MKSTNVSCCCREDGAEYLCEAQCTWPSHSRQLSLGEAKLRPSFALSSLLLLQCSLPKCHHHRPAAQARNRRNAHVLSPPPPPQAVTKSWPSPASPDLPAGHPAAPDDSVSSFEPAQPFVCRGCIPWTSGCGSKSLTLRARPGQATESPGCITGPGIQ